jgi:hypothetical protein
MSPFVMVAQENLYAELTDAAGAYYRARCIASHLSLEADPLKPGDMPSVNHVHPQHDLGENLVTMKQGHEGPDRPLVIVVSRG